MPTPSRAATRDFLDDVDLAVALAADHQHPGSLLREDGTLACCAGFGEHFAWCCVGVEHARLHQTLAARGVVRTSRLADLDAGDRAWELTR